MAEKENKPKNGTKKSSGKFSSKRNIFSRLFQSLKSFFEDKRLHAILGALFIITGLFLFVAFVSYFFHWGNDQSIITSFGQIFDKTVKAENLAGKVGAWAAHLFIFRWFGISAFLIALILLTTGIKIAFHISILPLGKLFRHSLIFLYWFPLFFSFVFAKFPILGGGVGMYMNQHLNALLGNIGVLLLIIFSALVYVVLVFNVSFENLKNIFASQPADETAIPQTQPVNNIDEDGFPIKKEMVITEPVRVEKKEIEFETVNATPEETKSDDVEFEIAQTTEGESAADVGEITAESLVEQYGEYDPTLDLPNYQKPTLDLLNEYGSNEININKDELEANKNKIIQTLNNYGIEIDKIKATVGPTVTLYEIVPAAGVRISKIKNLEDDIALSLAALGIRIIAPIPGRGTIGIEVPNSNPDIVSMRSMLSSEKFQTTKMDLPVALGKTISNESFIADLAKMPHLLMAGATGQGKSVGLNAILVSLLYKKHPSEIKFVLVDPKKVELTLFNKIEKHFLAKLPDSEDAIITDTKKVINTLNSLCIEMDTRYDLLKNAGAKNIKEYNAKFIARKLNPNEGHRFLPFIVLVVDEFADLIMTAGKEVEMPIARLAQLARAIGIHLIIATQRPSVNIITGTIKANFPARIAFRVTSKIDSRTILDTGGADQLIGRGDMLLSTGSDVIRIQCAFVDTPEVEKITQFIGEQKGFAEPFHLPEVFDEAAEGGDFGDPAERDSMFVEAARLVVQHQQGSASLIQRRLKLGYNRAGRIIDQLEAAGIVGPNEGSKARQVLFPTLESLEQYLKTSGLI